MSQKFWPNKEQSLLLQSALLPSKEACHAFELWRAHNNTIEDIEPVDYHFMPNIYNNISAAMASQPDREKLRGIYKYNWTYNQIRLQALISLLSQLPIQLQNSYLFMKGSAMILMGCYDIGARVMGDIDLLVTKEDTVEFIDFFLKHGFVLKHQPAQHVALSTLTNTSHAVVLTGKRGSVTVELDVHFSPFYHVLAEQFDDKPWFEFAQSLTYRDLPVRCLNGSHLLLQTCVHGMKYSPVPLFRWIMDAVSLMQHQPDLNWDLFLKHALQYQLTLPAREALRFLEKNYFVAVPQHVKKSLQNAPVSIFNKIEFHFLRKKTHPFIHALFILFSITRCSGKPLKQFLCERWDVSNIRQIAAMMLKKSSYFFFKASHVKKSN